MPLIPAHNMSITQGTVPVYCGMDSCLTHEINDALRRMPSGNDTVIYDFERAMQAPALEMMLRGFRVDPGARDIATRRTKEKLDAAKSVLATLAPAVFDRDLGEEFIAKLPNSGKKLKELFYERLGIPPIARWIRGEVTYPMDRKVLEQLEDYFYARPFVYCVLLIRDLNKTLQVLETEVDDDWRWRCSYNIAGTNSGRWSSSKSATGLGSNFQNITDELRRVFIADEGCEIVGLDGEQAEARDVGWFCGTILGDWSYLNMIEAGDPHTYVARICWPELPWNGDIKKDRIIAERKFYRHFTYRDATKRLGHGTNYLGKPKTMSLNTKIPVITVTKFRERYFDAFPCIPRMHQWIANEVQTKQFLVNFFGRRRDFFDRPNDEDTIKSAVAYMFQSSTGDRLNLGLWRVWKHMGTRVQVLAQLHDGMYFQHSAQGEERDAIIAEARKHATNIPLTHTLPNGATRVFTVPYDVVVGKNWAHKFRRREDGEVEEWNPKGLDKYRKAA